MPFISADDDIQKLKQSNAMKVHLFITAEKDAKDDTFMVVDAWDEFSIDADPDDYARVVNSYRTDSQLVKVFQVEVPYWQMREAFKPETDVIKVQPVNHTSDR